MDLIALAVPFFLLALLGELAIDRARGTGLYRANDAINSLSAGTLSTTLGYFTKLLPLIAWGFVLENFALIDMPLSWFETCEWQPSVTNDGRLVYTRWDYVDREASLYQQLWVSRPDGTNPAIYYGNNTFNPMATFEPRAVPGSDLIMAVAGCHHSIAAGSIVLIDIRQG